MAFPFGDENSSGQLVTLSFCRKCKVSLPYESRVSIIGVSGFFMSLCYSCAGYSYPKGFGFQDKKAEWIEASVSGMFYDEEHKGIIVDWLDENQRPGDAAFLREYYGLEVK